MRSDKGEMGPKTWCETWHLGIDGATHLRCLHDDLCLALHFKVWNVQSVLMSRRRRPNAQKGLQNTQDVVQHAHE